jgi:hypothetical protein
MLRTSPNRSSDGIQRSGFVDGKSFHPFVLFPFFCVQTRKLFGVWYITLGIEKVWRTTNTFSSFFHHFLFEYIYYTLSPLTMMCVCVCWSRICNQQKRSFPTDDVAFVVVVVVVVVVENNT